MIEFCFFHDYPSLELALKDSFHISKNQINKALNPRQRRLVIKARQIYQVPINLVNYLKINPQYSGPEIEIVHECESFLVLNKPIKVHSHPLQYSDTNCVHNFLRKVGKVEVLAVNQEHYDRGFVHRLDYETSGLLIGVKNQQLYDELKGLKQAEKIYYAHVEGIFPHQQLSDVIEGQPAHLEILENQFNETQQLSRLTIRLFEGHRHQIRKQLSSAGFPIIGDFQYGGKAAERLMLQSICCAIEYQNHKQKWELKIAF